MKKCSKCKIKKEFNLFNKNKHNKDGYYHYCKECRKQDYIINHDFYIQKSKEQRDKKRIIYNKVCISCNLAFKTKRSNSLCCNKKCYKIYSSSTQNTKLTNTAYYHKRKTDLNYRFSICKQKAASKNLNWFIKLEDYINLQNKPCHYCGISLLTFTSIGLDRIDNKKGYQLDNVLPCCGNCNKIRQDILTVFEMEEVAKLLKTLRN